VLISVPFLSGFVLTAILAVAWLFGGGLVFVYFVTRSRKTTGVAQSVPSP
jgi:hypothetical protein